MPLKTKPRSLLERVSDDVCQFGWNWERRQAIIDAYDAARALVAEPDATKQNASPDWESFRRRVIAELMEHYACAADRDEMYASQVAVAKRIVEWAHMEAAAALDAAYTPTKREHDDLIHTNARLHEVNEARRREIEWLTAQRDKALRLCEKLDGHGGDNHDHVCPTELRRILKGEKS